MRKLLRVGGTVALSVTGALWSWAAHAQSLPEGGPGVHSLLLGVSVDTLPGTEAGRYRIPAGATVATRYTVTDAGEADILDLRIIDPDIPSSAIDCDNGTIRLAALATHVCTAYTAAAATPQMRTVRATGRLYWINSSLTASAQAGYVGYSAGLSLAEEISGTQTSPAHPAVVVPGTAISVTYTATNTGNVPLYNVAVRARLRAGLKCPAGSLPPGGRMRCTASSVASVGLHADASTATASPNLTVLEENGQLTPTGSIVSTGEGAYLALARSPSVADTAPQQRSGSAPPLAAIHQRARSQGPNPQDGPAVEMDAAGDLADSPLDGIRLGAAARGLLSSPGHRQSVLPAPGLVASSHRPASPDAAAPQHSSVAAAPGRSPAAATTEALGIAVLAVLIVSAVLLPAALAALGTPEQKRREG